MSHSGSALQPSFTLNGELTYYDFVLLKSGGYGITYRAKAVYTVGRIKQTATFAVKEYFPRDLAVRNADGSVAPMMGKEKDFRECFDEFRREGEMLHGQEHSGIVPVNEVIETNGTIYYVMSYLGDMSLTRYVSEHGGQLGEEEARRVMHGLLDAVAYLHDQRLNHLDIKPDNVMMLESESGGRIPVLIDFGVSKHFHANGKQTSRLGGKGVTDGFAPLEQYAGITTFSPRADIYALGATFFYMLTGKTPKRAIEVSEVWIRENLPSDISQETADAICRSMSLDFTRRTADVKDFYKKEEASPKEPEKPEQENVEPVGKTVRIEEGKTGFSKKTINAICKAMSHDLDKRTAETTAFFGGTVGLPSGNDDPDPTPIPKDLLMKIGIAVGAFALILLLWGPVKKMFTGDSSTQSTQITGNSNNTDTGVTEPTNDSDSTGTTGVQLSVSNKALLKVECPTKGAQVYVNGQKKGSVPWADSLSANDYSIDVCLDGYLTQTQTVTLEAHESRTLSFPALSAIQAPATTGNLSVTYKPEGCDVYIDGRKAGTTPDVFQNITVGTHKVEIRKEGYITSYLKATVKEGETVKLTGSLTKKGIDDELTFGTKDLGYAIYEGELKGGQPDGEGTLTFQSTHAIDSRARDKEASPGDVVKGRFKDGHLAYGVWNKRSGEREIIQIGQ